MSEGNNAFMLNGILIIEDRNLVDRVLGPMARRSIKEWFTLRPRFKLYKPTWIEKPKPDIYQIPSMNRIIGHPETIKKIRQAIAAERSARDDV